MAMQITRKYINIPKDLTKKFLWFISLLLVPRYNLVIETFLFNQTATIVHSKTDFSDRH